MESQLSELQEDARSRIAAATTTDEVEELRRLFLGKKGPITQILRQMGSLPAGQRPAMGRLANETRDLVKRIIAQQNEKLSSQEQETALREEHIDVTLPGCAQNLGNRHPLSIVMDEVCEIFTSLGFEIVEGPEVETDWYNFVALNIPPDHPARDDHASFYITDDVLLRTETSAVQIRTMENREPPVRVIAPGRVYRRDAVDRTHSHTFHQVEGLLVDEQVTFADLKGTLDTFAKRMFGHDVRTTFRPHYFPFTEPSAEVDISCFLCGGDGCGVCKGTGWIEVLGSGMVHPAVLQNVGYDTERYNGFAFGMGVERLAMLKFGIDDMRLFYENDLRFLRQFA
ncbi:MAG: phenylalanine--tRNA ligase subunit alpha [Armatimonadetes bacterium CG2_30_59_28]|nr:phenylalanine--tRNA ligase subunit alpha [Armatimonadota bacterium]OIO89819.1 MAG: phenylalanine--tRNA ligase subunit alpha [Armatimonadetes bacterium CG2_30_59_28]PIU65431.1 MAG: phenylalanine--tRNA ligase subunit alpha [Armatimonadetes bacterium CG07_land_8_20_14_0_80_59_28]PIX44360.1 MAG: phenylalanine--tRNA ligase subunit alpha [Armatimonadetes bacterium CG_4_8_14_3_um_filter_58_9]PIY44556.1 MAG: phenylalanine--tRNA ligase subunit alpha [Armatimonadetes bacterium CG_4_10_14_3_um_filter_5